jgi:hypothetical protein
VVPCANSWVSNETKVQMVIKHNHVSWRSRLLRFIHAKNGCEFVFQGTNGYEIIGTMKDQGHTL